MNLRERAMNVSLHLSAWRGQRIDRKTTREVLDQKQADSDAGKFEKFLVPKRELDPVYKAHSAARVDFYRSSLPWGEDGLRIISSANFFEFRDTMHRHRTACDDAAAEFCARYPQLLASAPQRMNDLFDVKDFPDPQTMASKFGYRLTITPVPDKDDFRVTLGTDIEEEIRRDIEQTVSDRLGAAQHDLWGRLLDAVRHFAQTMHTTDKMFHATTVTKLADIARLAPKLSLTPDLKLEALCADILTVVNGLSPEDLRTNKRVREDAANRATDALSKIESAMQGAF